MDVIDEPRRKPNDFMTHIAIADSLDDKVVERMNNISGEQHEPKPKDERIVMNKVIVVIGAGSTGQAIARRVSAGKHLLLADLRPENADMAAKVLSEAGV